MQCFGRLGLTSERKYHPLGSADRVNDVLRAAVLSSRLSIAESVAARVQMALDFLHALQYLHTSPIGVI